MMVMIAVKIVRRGLSRWWWKVRGEGEDWWKIQPGRLRWVPCCSGTAACMQKPPGVMLSCSKGLSPPSPPPFFHHHHLHHHHHQSCRNHHLLLLLLPTQKAQHPPHLKDKEHGKHKHNVNNVKIPKNCNANAWLKTNLFSPDLIPGLFPRSPLQPTRQICHLYHNFVTVKHSWLFVIWFISIDFVTVKHIW